jgi:hypothetical protein
MKHSSHATETQFDASSEDEEEQIERINMEINKDDHVINPESKFI